MRRPAAPTPAADYRDVTRPMEALGMLSHPTADRSIPMHDPTRGPADAASPGTHPRGRTLLAALAMCSSLAIAGCLVWLAQREAHAAAGTRSAHPTRDGLRPQPSDPPVRIDDPQEHVTTGPGALASPRLAPSVDGMGDRASGAADDAPALIPTAASDDARPHPRDHAFLPSSTVALPLAPRGQQPVRAPEPPAEQLPRPGDLLPSSKSAAPPFHGRSHRREREIREVSVPIDVPLDDQPSPVAVEAYRVEPEAVPRQPATAPSARHEP